MLFFLNHLQCVFYKAVVCVIYVQLQVSKLCLLSPPHFFSIAPFLRK